MPKTKGATPARPSPPRSSQASATRARSAQERTAQERTAQERVAQTRPVQRRPATRATQAPPANAAGLPLAFGSWPSLLGFLGLCALLLAAPYFLSGFWPVSYDYNAQALFVSLTACVCLLMALRPQSSGASVMPRLRFSSASIWLLAFFAWCALASLFTVYWHDTLLEMARVGTCLAWFSIARTLLHESSGVTENGDTTESGCEALASRRVVVAGAVVLGGVVVSLLTLANYLSEGYPFSPFYNKNLLANFCAMSLPFGLAIALEGGRRARRRAIKLPLVAAAGVAALPALVIGAGLFVTSSKGGFLAALVAALVFVVAVWRAQSGALRAVWRAHRFVIAAAAVLLLAGGGAVASRTVVPRLLAARTSDDNSTMFRAHTWQATTRMIGARPLVGWGPGSFPSAYPQFADTGYTRTAHQLWLQIAAENGVPALLLLLGACGAGAVRGWRALRSESWPVAAAGLGALAAFATHGFTDAGWGITSITMLLFSVLALLDVPDMPDARRVEALRAEQNAMQTAEQPVRKSQIAHRSSLRWAWLGLTLLLALVSWAHQRAVASEESWREAWRFIKGGAPRTALQHAQEAAASDPLSVRMWTLLAAAQVANGQDAESSYKRAAQLRPTSAQTWLRWAGYRAEKIARGASGVPSPAPLFDRAVALDPNSPGIRLARGQWRLQQGDARGWDDLEHIARLADSAYGRYPAVLEIVDLDFARAYVKLAERALQNGDRKTARALIARGLKDAARARANYASNRAKALASGMEPPEDPAAIETVLKELEARAR